MVLGAQIASLVAAAVARDLAPPDRSILRNALKRILKMMARDAARAPVPRPVPKPLPAPPRKPRAPLFLAMYDAVTVENIPAGALAVAGYVNGRYQTVSALRARFPHAHLFTIAVNIGADADCLDVETGDATPAQAPEWVRRQLGAGLRRPCIYANRSTMPAVWAALHAAGIERNHVRLWVADWTEEPHIPTGYDACQWHGGMTVPFDESLCSPTFFS
jgi:hypothetical protein